MRRTTPTSPDAALARLEDIPEDKRTPEQQESINLLLADVVWPDPNAEYPW